MGLAQSDPTVATPSRSRHAADGAVVHDVVLTFGCSPDPAGPLNSQWVVLARQVLVAPTLSVAVLELGVCLDG